jgi:hypothetical protein
MPKTRNIAAEPPSSIDGTEPGDRTQPATAASADNTIRENTTGTTALESP